MLFGSILLAKDHPGTFWSSSEKQSESSNIDGLISEMIIGLIWGGGGFSSLLSAESQSIHLKKCVS